jgi:hypothetical protein
VTLAAKAPAIRTPTAGAHKPVWMKMALKPEQAQAIIKAVGNRKVNHGKLTHMHGFRGTYTILAHLLDMSLQAFRKCKILIVQQVDAL